MPHFSLTHRELESRWETRALPDAIREARWWYIRQVYVSPVMYERVYHLILRGDIALDGMSAQDFTVFLERARRDITIRAREVITSDGAHFWQAEVKTDRSKRKLGKGCKDKIECSTRIADSAIVRDEIFIPFMTYGGMMTEKLRYFVPLGGNTEAHVDIFTAPTDAAGRSIVEVEFENTAAMKTFRPPRWFGERTHASTKKVAFGSIDPRDISRRFDVPLTHRDALAHIVRAEV